jgi:hypothetical protein
MHQYVLLTHLFRLYFFPFVFSFLPFNFNFSFIFFLLLQFTFPSRDCRTSFSLAKNRIVGKCKNKITADIFKIFLLHLRYFIKFNKTTLLRRNGQKMPEICGDMLNNRPRGHLVSYWMETQRKMRPSGLHIYLGIS